MKKTVLLALLLCLPGLSQAGMIQAEWTNWYGWDHITELNGMDVALMTPDTSEITPEIDIPHEFYPISNAVTAALVYPPGDPEHYPVSLAPQYHGQFQGRSKVLQINSDNQLALQIFNYTDPETSYVQQHFHIEVTYYIGEPGATPDLYSPLIHMDLPEGEITQWELTTVAFNPYDGWITKAIDAVITPVPMNQGVTIEFITSFMETDYPAFVDSVEVEIANVPEPASAVIFGIGSLILTRRKIHRN